MGAAKEFFLDLREEVTRGEIIFAIIIFCVWSTIGTLIYLKISYARVEKNQEYYKAIQIDQDNEWFKYCMDTDAGNVLVTGQFDVPDEEKISLSEIKGSYLAVKKIAEKYNMKTRQEPIKNSKGEVTGYKTVTYYEWDSYGTDVYLANKLEFSGIKFNSSKFDVDSFYESLDISKNAKDSSKVRMGWLYENSSIFEHVGDKRYKFYYIPTNFKATIFVKCSEGTIENPFGGSKVSVDRRSIKDIIESKKKNYTFIFLVFWEIFFIPIAVVFVMKRNKWADC